MTPPPPAEARGAAAPLAAPRAAGPTQRRSEPRPGPFGPLRPQPRARALPVKDTRGQRRLLSVLLRAGPGRVSWSRVRAPRRSCLHEQPRPRRAPRLPSPRRQGRSSGRHSRPGPESRHGPRRPRGMRGQEGSGAPPALGAALTDRRAGTSTRARPTPLPPPPRSRYSPGPRGTPGNVVSLRGSSEARGRGGTARGGPWANPRGTGGGSAVPRCADASALAAGRCAARTLDCRIATR